MATDRSRVRRRPERAAYDAAAIAGVLDLTGVGHIGIAVDGRPVVIPMLYGRDGDVVYLHGSAASRLTRALAGGADVCLTVTVVDGLVLARSAFHHSMNYRSAVVFGRAEAVHGEEKLHALRVISEHLLPGRWVQVRSPDHRELRQTTVLRLTIEEASVKARRGGPIDDPEDLDLPVWAGVLPCALWWDEPVVDDGVPAGAPLPPRPPSRC